MLDSAKMFDVGRALAGVSSPFCTVWALWGREPEEAFHLCFSKMSLVPAKVLSLAAVRALEEAARPVGCAARCRSQAATDRVTRVALGKKLLFVDVHRMSWRAECPAPVAQDCDNISEGVWLLLRRSTAVAEKIDSLTPPRCLTLEGLWLASAPLFDIMGAGSLSRYFLFVFRMALVRGKALSPGCSQSSGGSRKASWVCSSLPQSGRNGPRDAGRSREEARFLSTYAMPCTRLCKTAIIFPRVYCSCDVVQLRWQRKSTVRDCCLRGVLDSAKMFDVGRTVAGVSAPLRHYGSGRLSRYVLFVSRMALVRGKALSPGCSQSSAGSRKARWVCSSLPQSGPNRPRDAGRSREEARFLSTYAV
ncbi:hypothetical protein Efla_007759 [Eimeria flavescens]